MDQAKATPPAALPPEPAVVTTWPRCVQLAVAVLLALGIGFLLGRYFTGSASIADLDDSPANEASIARLDLNRASRAELALLPGFGPSRAQSVDDYRRQHGPFRSVDDLRKVSGIGPKTLERVRSHVFVDATLPSAPPAQSQATLTQQLSTAATKSKKEAGLTAPIDVNRANAAELQKLPGVGAKIAQRIIDERTLRGPFKTVDELRRVPGIGPKTLEKLRPHVVIDVPLTAGTPIARNSVE
jgi:competence protein ComEA